MSNKELNLTKNTQKGFSLVETLVAIFILAMAISSAMAVAQSSLMASFFARDRVTAYFLAQEAVEVIKNIRDENRLVNREQQSTTWSSGILEIGCDANNKCGVDINNNSIGRCEDLNECRLYRDETSGIFSHSSGNETRFTRTVEIESINNYEIKITVTVTWPQALSEREFEMTEHIFNWLSFGG